MNVLRPKRGRSGRIIDRFAQEKIFTLARRRVPRATRLGPPVVDADLLRPAGARSTALPQTSSILPAATTAPAVGTKGSGTQAE